MPRLFRTIARLGRLVMPDRWMDARIGISTGFGDYERQALNHQAGDEGNIA
jgi:hypothetical protein